MGLKYLAEKYFLLVDELKELQRKEDEKKKQIQQILYEIKLLQEKKS